MYSPNKQLYKPSSQANREHKHKLNAPNNNKIIYNIKRNDQ